MNVRHDPPHRHGYPEDEPHTMVIFLISQRQDFTCAGAPRLPRVSHVNAALLTPPALLCLTVHFLLLTKSVTWDDTV